MNFRQNIKNYVLRKGLRSTSQALRNNVIRHRLIQQTPLSAQNIRIIVPHLA